MFNVVCFTNRNDCADFFAQLEKIAQSEIDMIILREKDMSEEEYFSIVIKAKEICEKYGKKLVVHKFINTAKRLGIRNIHLPFSEFCNGKISHTDFDVIGTSVHSAEDAVYAEKNGADYIVAGHVFATDCKKGLAPRGVEFLEDVCKSVAIPVYAIGGIDESSVKALSSLSIRNFSGVCIMSGLMKSENPAAFAQSIKKNYEQIPCKNSGIYKLYAVTDRQWLGTRKLKDDVESALRGGATLVQLREKNMDFDAFCHEAEEIHRLCQNYNVALIINDNVQVAKTIGAEGVHLGQGDMNPVQARKILGSNKIIGVTARSVQQAIKAEADGADYLGSGAIFGTSTKSDAVKMSFETLESICSSVHIPIVAIGGITMENVTELNGINICGIATISGIFAQENIQKSARVLKQKVEEIVNGK